MSTSQDHALWLAHPTGKIARGTFCQSCARYNARTLAVNALILDGTRVLLVQRGEEPDKGWWDIPGGYLDWDETLEEGAARELKEETGLLVDTKDFVFLSLFSNPNNKAQNQVVDVYFVSRIYSGELKIDGQEIVKAEWFDLNELPQTVAFDHMVALKKLRYNNCNDIVFEEL